MRRTRRTYRLMAMLAVACGAALAFALPANALSDVQVKSPPNHLVAIEPTATLEANGAATMTSLDIFCPKGVQAYVTVIVTEVVNGTIVSGSASHAINNCNGQAQSIQVGVTPSLKPFARGVAFGQAELSYYTNNGTRSAWDERTIRIN